MEDDAIYFDIKKPESLVEKVKDILNDKYDLLRLSLNGAKKIKSIALKQRYMEKLSGIYKQYLHWYNGKTSKMVEFHNPYGDFTTNNKAFSPNLSN